jgi:hypothetical protein
MTEFLKGNFEVKRPVETVEDETDTKTSDEVIAEALRKAAMTSIGGSMVYVERTPLSWDGDDE